MMRLAAIILMVVFTLGATPIHESRAMPPSVAERCALQCMKVPASEQEACVALCMAGLQ